MTRCQQNRGKIPPIGASQLNVGSGSFSCAEICAANGRLSELTTVTSVFTPAAPEIAVDMNMEKLRDCSLTGPVGTSGI